MFKINFFFFSLFLSLANSWKWAPFREKKTLPFSLLQEGTIHVPWEEGTSSHMHGENALASNFDTKSRQTGTQGHAQASTPSVSIFQSDLISNKQEQNKHFNGDKCKEWQYSSKNPHTKQNHISSGREDKSECKFFRIEASKFMFSSVKIKSE